MIGIFLTDGFEEMEALSPADILRRAGAEVQLLSVTGSRAVQGAHQITVQADALAESCDLTKLELLLLPGGPGTDGLTRCAPLMHALELFMQNDRPVAAICAAPSILGRMGLVRGRHCTVYPGFESKMDDALLEKGCVRDANLITAEGPGYSVPFALEIAALLRGRAAADRVREQIRG